jgi:hypothetical protein
MHFELRRRVMPDGWLFASQTTDARTGRAYKNLEILVRLPSKKRKFEEQWILELDTEEGCRPVGWFNPKEKPQDAPIIHFGGVLKLGGISPGLKLIRGGPPTELYVGISLWSPGFTPAMLKHGKGIPDDVHPVAEIVFPRRTPDTKPVTVRIPLLQRCWGNQFHDSVRVPSEVGLGKARITVSIASWKNVTVKPFTVEVEVVESR